MGSGTDVAKQAADIIILDDNFTTIVTACKWGRSIYENIRKFLQFQLTVNVVALILLVISSTTQYIIPTKDRKGIELPITAIQLLWLNLIMDTLAALALATESPDDSLLDRKPYGKTESLITSHMWVAILTQGVFQLIILFIIFYTGEFWCSKPAYYSGYSYTAIQTNNTMVFNTFVLFQLFNLFNARKIFKNEWNFCKGILKSYLFIIIVVLCVFIQIAFVELGRSYDLFLLLKTTGLDYIQWPLSIGIAALTIPFHFIVVKPLQLIVPDFKQSWRELNFYFRFFLTLFLAFIAIT